MPRKGSNIYKRKDGRWEGRYIKDRQPSGKAVFGYVYAYSYKEAKAKLNLAISGQSCSSKCRTPGSTISELSALWLENQKVRVKESTYNKYRNILNKYILPDIGSVCLQELSLIRVSELCDTLLTRGGQHGNGLSEKTIADTISVIRSVIQYSANIGYCCSFDVHALRIHQKPQELRILSHHDQKMLYTYLCENPCIHNIGILIYLLTGLRIGKVCALCWEDAEIR